jgi:hypothetical protein
MKKNKTQKSNIKLAKSLNRVSGLAYEGLVNVANSMPIDSEERESVLIGYEEILHLLVKLDLEYERNG